MTDAIRTVIRVLLITTASLSLSPVASAAHLNGGGISVAKGTVLVVRHTTRLSRLVVAKGGKIIAPEGHSLTLTVNGTGTEIAPGHYTGHLVLTVTRNIVVHYMKLRPEHFRAAIYVRDGKRVPSKSVAAEVTGGKVTNNAATDIAITSHQQKFNGIIVTGKSHYSIINPRITLIGNSTNDFDGFGAGILATGHAKVLVKLAKIFSKGVVRPALVVGGHAIVTIKDSTIEVRNGVLPASYKFTIQPGKMWEVPYGLGISGNVRATVIVGHGTVYYDNDHITAQAWGALSTDGEGPTWMYVNNSKIRTVDSGYGAYANGLAHDYFSHCVFNVATYGLIIGGPGSGTFTDGTVVNSGKYGVMMHQGTGGGTLTIEKGSVFNTKLTAIEVKGRGTNIVVDDARLHPGNGVILQTMDNDDPIMRAMAEKMARKSNAKERRTGMMPGLATMIPGSPASALRGFDGNVRATFNDVTLHGNIYHAMTNLGNLTVHLRDATITGAISTSIASPCSGKEPTRKTYYMVGCVKNALAPAHGGHGLSVILGKRSEWIVSRTSYLNKLVISNGAAVTAMHGRSVTLVIDGRKQSIGPGHYAGNLVLKVTSAAAR